MGVTTSAYEFFGEEHSPITVCELYINKALKEGRETEKEGGREGENKEGRLWSEASWVSNLMKSDFEYATKTL